MKKLIFALLWVMLVVFWGVGPVGSALGGTYSGGSGTEADPYRIATPADMNEIGANRNDWGTHFVMVNDINLANYTGTQFNIIGTDYDHAFTGVFDGNGHTISNFTYTISDNYEIGIFGYVKGANALVKDLHLSNPIVNTEHANAVGSLVGCLEQGRITGCSVTGGSVSGGGLQYGLATGGLVGRNYAGTISNCHAATSVMGRPYTRNSYIAGLVGSNNYGMISNCYATGSVSGTYHICAGLVASNYEGTIWSCYATGSVVANGTIYWGSSAGLVTNNYGTISNCYATGSVMGGEYATGGLVAKNDSGGIVNTSFWDMETTDRSSSAGGEGKTTAQMQTMSTFTAVGWDFVGEEENGTDDIWSIHEGIDYPVLVWEIVNFVGWYEVDMLDFAFFANHWMNSNCGDWDDCEGTDIDFSGSVDMADLVIFTNRWLIGK